MQSSHASSRGPLSWLQQTWCRERRLGRSARVHPKAATQHLIGVVLACLALAGCAKAAPAEGKALDESAVRAALRTYADVAYASYDDSVQGAQKLARAVQVLIDAPSAAHLEAARKAWLLARVPYRQTEVFRFYDGPIDAVELLVNTWPIDEQYVESGARDRPGIVENIGRYPNLSNTLLTSLNGKDGETSISTGYHVIEFMLWGADTNADGPGSRSFQAFVVDGPDAELAKRRGQVLARASELLVMHLTQVSKAWSAHEADNYRARFLALPPRDALALVIKGMGTLSGAELAGERMTVAYETKDQEHEHSCFSDSTQSDFVGNVRGIENVCLGRYASQSGQLVSGKGLCELLKELAPPYGAELAPRVSASLSAVSAIPQPFDRAIGGSDDTPGREAVAAAIKALAATAETLASVSRALSLSAKTSLASVP